MNLVRFFFYSLSDLDSICIALEHTDTHTTREINASMCIKFVCFVIICEAYGVFNCKPDENLIWMVDFQHRTVTKSELKTRWLTGVQLNITDQTAKKNLPTNQQTVFISIIKRSKVRETPEHIAPKQQRHIHTSNRRVPFKCVCACVCVCAEACICGWDVCVYWVYGIGLTNDKQRLFEKILHHF